jgi:hypothetical protein
MRLNLDAITRLAGTEGRNTLSVLYPQLALNFVQGGGGVITEIPLQNTVEYPDEYFFMYNVMKERPVIGKERGDLFLTKKGYDHFRLQIAAVRANSPRHQDIESLDAYAHEFFRRIEQRLVKQQREYEAKLAELHAGISVTQA